METLSHCTCSLTILVRSISILDLSIMTTLQQFTYISPSIRPWLPSTLMLAELESPHGSSSWFPKGCVVPEASYRAVASPARPGRVLSAE